MRYLVIALVASACATAGPLEIVALPDAPPPGPLLVLREALDGCVSNFDLRGDLSVRLELDRHGKVIFINSGYGDGFASCVGNAMLRWRYREYTGRTLLITFTVGA